MVPQISSELCRRYVQRPLFSDVRFILQMKYALGSIDKAEFLNILKYMKGITYQYYFGTEESIQYLSKL